MKTLGMIAVAPDHVLELRKTFRVRRQHARLVEHQHSEFVAGVEKLRRRRVVRRANGVAAHFLQLPHAEILHGIRQGHADAGMILVVARALHLDRLAVQEEALVSVELQVANPEARFIAIRYGPAGLDLGDQLVEVPLLQRPQRRLPDRHLLFVAALARYRNGGRRAGRFPDFLAGGVENR